MLSVAVWLCEAINLLDTFPTFSVLSLHVEPSGHDEVSVVVAMVVVPSGAVVVTLSGVVPHRVGNEVLFNAEKQFTYKFNGSIVIEHAKCIPFKVYFCTMPIMCMYFVHLICVMEFQMVG